MLMVDANQVWDVDEAIDVDARLAPLRPVLDRGADEPRRHPRPRARSPAAVAPIGVATGEHVHNRVMFKQLLQAEAIGFCQIDACRLGGVNEVLAVLLLAAQVRRAGVPARGRRRPVRATCSTCRRSTTSRVSGSLDDRMIEYVDHLHEHFVDPVVVDDGRYRLPEAAGLQRRDARGVARAVRAFRTARCGRGVGD